MDKAETPAARGPWFWAGLYLASSAVIVALTLTDAIDPQIGPDGPSWEVTRGARGATYRISVTNSGAA
jgi:hypothetical protein